MTSRDSPTQALQTPAHPMETPLEPPSLVPRQARSSAPGPTFLPRLCTPSLPGFCFLLADMIMQSTEAISGFPVCL